MLSMPRIVEKDNDKKLELSHPELVDVRQSKRDRNSRQRTEKHKKSKVG